MGDVQRNVVLESVRGREELRYIELFINRIPGYYHLFEGDGYEEFGQINELFPLLSEIRVPSFGSCVLKKLKVVPGYSTEPEADSLRELANTAMPSFHPNIVDFFGFVYREWGGNTVPIAMILERCEKSLFDEIQNVKELPEKQIVIYSIHIARALAFVHERGVIHRDIKTSNILLKNGIAKLCDFGLSKTCVERNTRDKGTYCYIAPEILDGSGANVEYDVKADVFSFALTVQEMYNRVPPFYHDYGLGIDKFPEVLSSEAHRLRLLGHTDLPARPPFTNQRSICSRMKSLIVQCWNTNPILRPSMNSVLAELEEIGKEMEVFV